MESNNQNPPPESDALEQSDNESTDGAASPAASSGSSPAASRSSGTSSPKPGDTPKKGGIKAIIFSNKYLIVFAVLLLLAGGGIFATLNASKKNTPAVIKTTSLTSSELTALKGNTTVVGDSQQVLNVQSNSIFEGQVLLRNNLEVAGTLKVGAPLSVPGLTVGGISSLSQVGISNTLTVTGKTTLQGEVAIQKTLSVAGAASFGSISTTSFSVSNLQLTGDITLPRHISVTGGVPGKVDGGALGSGGTTSVSGTDTAGTVNINTGTGAAAGILVTINFTQKFNTTPHVVITPVGPSAAGLNYYISRNVTSFTIGTTTAPPPNASFSFDYIAID